MTFAVRFLHGSIHSACERSHETLPHLWDSSGRASLPLIECSMVEKLHGVRFGSVSSPPSLGIVSCRLFDRFAAG